MLLHGDKMVVACRGPGESILLAVGGANESLLAHPGACDLVLKRRQGFVRIALLSGASLVPCVSFGENNLYRTAPGGKGSWVRRLQK